jgi:hypothetical protein
MAKRRADRRLRPSGSDNARRRGGYAAVAVAALAGVAAFGTDALAGLDVIEELDLLDALDPAALERLRPPLPRDFLLWAVAGAALLFGVQRQCVRLGSPQRSYAAARSARGAWAAAIAVVQAASRAVTTRRSHRAMAPAKQRVAAWIRRSIRSPGAIVYAPWGSDLTQEGCWR